PPALSSTSTASHELLIQTSLHVTRSTTKCSCPNPGCSTRAPHLGTSQRPCRTRNTLHWRSRLDCDGNNSPAEQSWRSHSVRNRRLRAYQSHKHRGPAPGPLRVGARLRVAAVSIAWSPSHRSAHTWRRG